MWTVPLSIGGDTVCVTQPASPSDTVLFTNKAQVINMKSWAHRWKESGGTRLRNHRERDTSVPRAPGWPRTGPARLPAASGGCCLCFHLCKSLTASLQELCKLIGFAWTSEKNPPSSRANLRQQERAGRCRELNPIKSPLQSSPRGHEDSDLLLVLQQCVEWLSRALSHQTC